MGCVEKWQEDRKWMEDTLWRIILGRLVVVQFFLGQSADNKLQHRMCLDEVVYRPILIPAFVSTTAAVAFVHVNRRQKVLLP